MLTTDEERETGKINSNVNDSFPQLILLMFIHKIQVIRSSIGVNLLIEIDKPDTRFWQKKYYDV